MSLCTHNGHSSRADRRTAFDPEQTVEYSLKPLCFLEKAAEKLAGDVLAPEGFYWSYRDGDNSEGQEI